MTKSVLCAVDLADATPDERPLRVAADIAAREGAGLTVVTVVPDLGVGEVASYLPPDFEETAVARAREKLDAFVDRVVGDKLADVRRRVAVGRVTSEVLRVAEEVEADLIVVGAKAPNIADRLLGSNASQIVLHSNASVYVVR